jgi:predicted phage terminase large subunit-like protein
MSSVNIAPQPGPQQTFLSTPADIAIYGGAAGGGKTFALLLEPLRHFYNDKFSGVIFRRSTTQVRNPGGLWDESMSMYRQLGAHPRESVLEWVFPSKMTMKFAHLEHERTVYDWQGSQISYIGFDELTHFSEKQFFYMLSRNRSDSGVAGYVRCTCNPDADSWVRKFIDWWIGPEGLPVPERSGVMRWFVRQGDDLIWADTREELVSKYGSEQMPKSVTFINSNVYDNKILMEKDPSYLSNLLAQPTVERMRLLGGNWNIRAASGLYFKRDWFETIDAIPAGWSKCVRYWDRAATKPNPNNKNPDWTAGLKMYGYPNGTFVIADVRRDRDTPLNIETLVKNTASFDGHSTFIYIEQDPGSAGVAEADNYIRLLQGYAVFKTRPTKDKLTRALPVSAQAQAGNLKVLRAPWNEDFFKELENFPPNETASIKRVEGDDDRGHDDQVDALSGAFNELCANKGILDTL